MIFHYGLNKDIKNGVQYLIPDGHTIRKIYQVGIPAIIMQALMSFMTYGVNIILAGINASYVTAYGVYYKIQQFALFAAFGLNNAIIPLVAYNYGKGDVKRIKESVFYGTLYTVIIMLICMVIFEIFAPQISGIFALSSSILAICTSAMRIISAALSLSLLILLSRASSRL
jgi:Na+-driven multidrug efflux pump